jgi:hypothetical protein
MWKTILNAPEKSHGVCTLFLAAGAYSPKSNEKSGLNDMVNRLLFVALKKMRPPGLTSVGESTGTTPSSAGLRLSYLRAQHSAHVLIPQ